MLGQILNIAGEELKYSFASFRHRLRSSNRHLEKVLVNGSPKTGTTWMLKMMVSVPGYQGARAYNFQGDIDQYRQMLPGEVVHGHDPYTTELGNILFDAGVKVILMIRDPRDRLVSHMFHIKRDATLPWHEAMKEMSDEEALLVCIEGGLDKLPNVEQMQDLTQSWLGAGDKALCVKYEDLILDPMSQLHRVFQYLDIVANDKLLEAIVERNRFERMSIGSKVWKAVRKPGQQDATSHFRKGIVGDWKNHFKKEHVQRFKELAGQTLVDLGYEKDLNW